MADLRFSFSGKKDRNVLAAGDLITLVLFIYVGQRDHGTFNTENPLLGLFLASWEFALIWLVVGWPLRTYGPLDGQTLLTLYSRPLLTWFVAAPLALLLRALVLGRLNIPTLFFAATLGFGILFLFIWRTFYWLGGKLLKRKFI